jgi:DNA-binding GntR family transcriptional regulator
VNEESLASKTYRTIKRDIITCVLPPGERIVQSQLAEQYGFTATPVRDALQRLSQEGLVTVIPRVGYVVTEVTLSDVFEIFELRSTAETAAARLAALRASEESLTRIADHALFTYTYGDRASYSEFLERNAEFHRSIAVASGNRRLADLITGLLDELTRLFHLGLDLRDSAAEMRQEHLDLAKALCARDATSAHQIAYAQIDRSRARIMEAIAARVGPDAAGLVMQIAKFRIPEP